MRRVLSCRSSSAPSVDSGFACKLQPSFFSHACCMLTFCQTLNRVSKVTHSMMQCGVSGGIVVLSSLTNLDTLALQGTKVRPLAVERLQQLLPQLRVQGGAQRG